jgi:hypothetical protein
MAMAKKIAASHISQVGHLMSPIPKAIHSWSPPAVVVELLVAGVTTV